MRIPLSSGEGERPPRYPLRELVAKRTTGAGLGFGWGYRATILEHEECGTPTQTPARKHTDVPRKTLAEAAFAAEAAPTGATRYCSGIRR